jgi:hypothetical protein
MFGEVFARNENGDLLQSTSLRDEYPFEITKNANPWAQQCWNDIVTLGLRPEFNEWFGCLKGYPLAPFLIKESRDEFIEFDVTILRYSEISEIQQRRNSQKHGSLDEIQECRDVLPIYVGGATADGFSSGGRTELPHVCEISVNGLPCGQAFSSTKELKQHQIHSTREGHGKSAESFRHHASTLTVTNQCPLCLKVYKDRHQAVKHVTTVAMKYSVCPDKGGSNLNSRVKIPDSLSCPRCIEIGVDIHFDTLPELQKHIALVHLQPIRPAKLPSTKHHGHSSSAVRRR